MEEGHLPVMVEEVIDALSPVPGGFRIDATLGGGGHTRRILEATTPGGRVLGITTTGESLANALRHAYEAADIITFEGMHYRRDIGQKGLLRNAPLN